MSLNEVHNIYFIGIGGIGMSALARFYRAKGLSVAGYDRTSTALTSQLEKEGMQIHFEDAIEQIPSSFLDKEKTLVIYTPAVPKDHKELNFLMNEGYRVIKRSVALGEIVSEHQCIAVAGTHGKTTTSSMVAHVLKDCGLPMAAFLGGITANYKSNFICTENPEFVVVEADEFDRSFLTLSPTIAVLTSTDADHLDIYENKESIEEAFQAFAYKTKENGHLFVKAGLDIRAGKNVAKATYAAREKANLSAQNITVSNGAFHFDVLQNDTFLGSFSLKMGGQHNVENALAAIAVGLTLNIDLPKIQSAIASFEGIKRRFETVFSSEEKVYIDDYAHHPTELNACIHAVRELYPGKHLTAVFQPHLFSRTRDFEKGFIEALSQVDTLILMDIYPARELPIDGVSSEIILNKISLNDKHLANKQNVMEVVKENLDKTDVLLTVGAGDIDLFVQPIAQLLQAKNVQHL